MTPGPSHGGPVVLGAALLVGEVLGLPVGLAEGIAVGEADWLGRPLEGRGVGLAFTGGPVGAAGVRAAGDSRSVAVGRGRRVASLFRSRALPLAGCVVSRSGVREAPGDSVTGTSGSSEDARSGLGAASGALGGCWGSNDVAARPPSTAKVAAARVRPPYFFSRGAERRRADGASAEGAGDQEASGDWKEPGPSMTRASSAARSDAHAPPLSSLGVAMSESYAPHSGHVTAPLRARRQGRQ